MSLPENILRAMTPADRKRRGEQTSEEAMAAFTARSEKELQQQVSNLLRLRGLKFLNPAMHKRSPLPEGHPDFTVFLPGGRTIFFECKTEKGKLSDEQEDFAKWANANDFFFYVIRSVREAIDCLEGMK